MTDSTRLDEMRVMDEMAERIRELEAKLDAVEQQDSEYTRKLEVALTAASLLPEKWRDDEKTICGCGRADCLVFARRGDDCADELEAALNE